MAAEGKAGRPRQAAGGSGSGGAELEGGNKLLRRGRQRQARPVAPPGQGYFTAGLAALFLCLTALLVFLPLVLPPLPPPPLLLPVGLMAVLLSLALLPPDCRGATAGAVASSCVY